MRQKSSRTISRSWHNRGLKCKRNLPFHSGRFLLCCFFLFFLCACFCGLLSRFQLFAGFFVPLVFRVVHAHAGDLVPDRHDGVAQEHAALGAVHNGEEFLRRLRAETRTVAAVADRLCDAVGTTIHLCKDGGEERGAARAELPVPAAVMIFAVDAEGLADVLLLLRDVVFKFWRFALREEA